MSYAPYPPDFGGARRTYNLIEQAAEAGHELHLLCFSSGSDAEDRAVQEHLGQFAASVKLVRDINALPAARGDADKEGVARKRRGQVRSLLSLRPYQFYSHYSEAMQRELVDTLREVKPHLAQVEFSQMGYYGLPPKLPTLLDLHNVEYEVLERTARQGGGGMFRRVYNYAEYVKFRRDEPRIWQRFTHLLTTSRRDSDRVRQLWNKAQTTVVPNGVDTEYFHPGAADGAGATPTIIFTGMMAYFPNVDGVTYFNNEIWPLTQRDAPQARWIIMGSDPLPEVQSLAGPKVTVTGRVDDVRPGVWEAEVCVVPLRIGGGTRLKIVEALAMGKAVVTTSIGCEGLEAQDGVHLLIRDDPQSFAAAVVQSLGDAELRHKLGSAGRSLALTNYDWSVTAKPMLDVWQEIGRR